ncbi:MAG TPA: dipeptide ABC transporter ATP-binding protein [Alphaproteobacteria bacterium]|nr:dipeptide ABC transporter ATP-binding protein [Alphaproteobacteria bacterium]
MSQAALLSVRDLKVHFPVRIGGIFGRIVPVRAVDGVSFDLRAGETLGVVGESGCGKSTLGRAILQLIPPSAGAVIWLGERIDSLSQREMRAKREDMQIIFQDPLASLDPRMTIGDIIAEPLRTFQPKLGRAKARARVEDMLAKVGLLPQMINRYPHEFSGGQCQRIGIARAMILKPRLIVCDEPVSALDVSIQAQIVNLLMELQREFGLTLIFISHNLSVVRHISHRILVLYLGRVMELADRDQLYRNPRHPYTQALISAVPIPDPDLERRKERIVLAGDLPSPLAPPSGCVFRTRCPYATQLCAEDIPPLDPVEPGHHAACHHWQAIAAGEKQTTGPFADMLPAPEQTRPDSDR